MNFGEFLRCVARLCASLAYRIRYIQQEGYIQAYTIGLSINEDLKLKKGKEKTSSNATIPQLREGHVSSASTITFTITAAFHQCRHTFKELVGYILYICLIYTITTQLIYLTLQLVGRIHRAYTTNILYNILYLTQSAGQQVMRASRSP